MTVHLLKNRSDDSDLKREDPYEQHIENANFIPILRYVPVDEDGLTNELSQDYDGLIVTSQRAVDVVKSALDMTDPVTREKMLSLPAYTVGPATAERLRLIGFKNVEGAGTGNGEALAAFMASSLSPNQKLLFTAGEIHRKLLPNRLEELGHSVRTVVVYRSQELDPLPQLEKDVRPHDWIVFFSPSNTDRVCEFIKSCEFPLDVAAIGPTTEAYLKESGFRSVACAPSPSAESLASVIQR